MTVYLAAVDETQNQKGDFTLGGFLAPAEAWKKDFEPAWDERVLAGNHRIPYLHMTEIRSDRWRAKHGISGLDAESRVDEAIRVIRSTGSLYPISSGIRVDQFRTIFAEPIGKLSGDRWAITHDPDYLCFIAFAVLVLMFAEAQRPDATKVNFLVEHSDKTTRYIRRFHSQAEGGPPAVPKSACPPRDH